MKEIFSKTTLDASVSVPNTLSFVLMLSRVGRISLKEYMLAMVLRTTPWSKSSRDTFNVALVVAVRPVPSFSLPQFSER